MSWKIYYGNTKTSQIGSNKSFSGGKPHMPRGLTTPHCELCNQTQAFILQVQFPKEHPWSELILSIFACMSCANENYLIPEMLPGRLHQINVPSSFLKRYQRNFRFLVFNSAESTPLSSYKERVIYRPLELIDSEKKSIQDDIVGGQPYWLLEDETPGLCETTSEPIFLMQIAEGRKFFIQEKASKQIRLDLSGDPKETLEEYYQLFLGNVIYLFGYERNEEYLVYGITQT
ncbi:hypothetical protein U2F10_12095 [Leptothoe sp. EHU-05/26/07-4]